VFVFCVGLARSKQERKLAEIAGDAAIFFSDGTKEVALMARSHQDQWGRLYPRVI